MANNKIRVAITQGDTNGIGYELILKTFMEQEILELCIPIIYGSPKIASRHRDALQIQCPFSIIKDAHDARDGRVNLIPYANEEVKVELGQPSEEAASAAVKALDKALADGSEGLYDVLVCGPMDKGNLHIKDTEFPGIVKFIGNSVGNDSQIQPLYVNNIIRMASVSDGGVEDVNGVLTQESIVNKVKALQSTLRRDFRLSSPRIAVLALNAEEENEEQEIIAPAIKTLSDAGVPAFGPYYTADFFDTRKYESFDAVLAMYYEQGMQQVRMLTDEESVAVLTNIPSVCTMPDTGARHDIAGKNVADEAVLRNAIYTAIDIFRHRKEYDAPMANPLLKLYHERPDNGEKLRFSIPKKKDDTPA